MGCLQNTGGVVKLQLARPNDLLQPRHEVLHVKGLVREELHDVVVNRLRVRGNRKAVDAQEDIDYGERHPLIAIHKWMVLHEALQKRGGLVNQRVVVTGLRPMQG